MVKYVRVDDYPIYRSEYVYYYSLSIMSYRVSPYLLENLFFKLWKFNYRWCPSLLEYYYKN